MKIFKSCLFLIVASFSCQSFSAGNQGVTITPSLATPFYWTTCWFSVTATAFGPDALKNFDDVESNFSNSFATPFKLAIEQQSTDKIMAASSANKAIILTIVQNHQSASESKHKMEMSTLDSEMAFLESLAEADIKNKHKGFFTDGNGEDGTLIKDSNSYKYSEIQCTRDKIMKSVASTKSREKTSQKLSIETKAQETKNSKILSVEGFQNILQKKHFEKYCSIEESEALLCEDESDFPLGDINSTNFLFPEGNGSLDVNDDGFFKTRYTYSQAEEIVAKDFINNVIFAVPTKKPTIAEVKNTSKSEFILAYNRKYSSLNLSNYSFQKAYEKRVAKSTNKEGTPLSSHDLYRYQMENTLSADGKLAVQNSKKKGVDFMVYSAMLVENNLELERLLQQERIEILLAAINAARLNTSSVTNSLNSLK